MAVKKQIPSILSNVEIALASADHVQLPRDAGAVAALLRLSMLLDSLFDSGESREIPQLLARHTQLLGELRLTPKSRAEMVAPVSEVDHGKEFAENYLRLVKTPSAVKSSQGSKPRKSSSGSGRKPRPAVDGVAEARNGAGSRS